MDTGAYMENQMDNLIEAGIQHRDEIAKFDPSQLKETINSLREQSISMGINLLGTAYFQDALKHETQLVNLEMMVNKMIIEFKSHYNI